MTGNCAMKRIWPATVMLGALGAAAAAAPVTINIAIGSEPSSLDPQLVQDGAERWVNDNTYDTLMVRNAVGVLAPGLAAEMPKPIDPTTWQFKLRPGIKFHDGEPHVLDEDRPDRGVQKREFRREVGRQRTVSVRRVGARPAHRSRTQSQLLGAEAGGRAHRLSIHP